jgi:hypothetical protein
MLVLVLEPMARIEGCYLSRRNYERLLRHELVHLRAVSFGVA